MSRDVNCYECEKRPRCPNQPLGFGCPDFRSAETEAIINLAHHTVDAIQEIEALRAALDKKTEECKGLKAELAKHELKPGQIRLTQSGYDYVKRIEAECKAERAEQQFADLQTRWGAGYIALAQLNYSTSTEMPYMEIEGNPFNLKAGQHCRVRVILEPQQKIEEHSHVAQC